MSFKLILRLNLCIVFDLLIRNSLLVVKFHQNHHLKSCHVNFVLFIKVSKNVKRTKIELPWKNSSELLFFMICWWAIKFLHIEICEYVNRTFKHRRDHTAYLWIIIWPISRGQYLYLHIIRNFLFQIPFLKFTI